MTTDDKTGLELEQEALAGFDKLASEFSETQPDTSEGKGLGEGYAEETMEAVGLEEAADAAVIAAAAETVPAVDASFAQPEVPSQSEPEAEEQPAPEALEPEEPTSEENASEAAAAGTAAAAAAIIPGRSKRGASFRDKKAAKAEKKAAKEAAKEAAAAEVLAEEAPKEKKKSRKERKAEALAAAAAADAAGSEDNTTEPKKKKKKKHVFLKIILGLLIVGFVACVGVAGYAGYYVYQVIQDAPEINPNNIYDLLAENSVIYDTEGNVLATIYADKEGLRSNVDYSELPENLKAAFTSIEDKTFWDHNGFNLVRLFGAVWNSAKTGFRTKISGTSTLTQQLARNIFLSTEKSERSMERKIREAYYTILIERALSKEQILEAYLNTVYLGYNAYGVGAAAESYFSKEVKDLTLEECAMLAALPQNPATYAPLMRISNAKAQELSLDVVSEDDYWTVYYNSSGEGRMRLVLRMMYEQGKIDEETYNSVKGGTIRPFLNPGRNIEVATETTYMSDYVKSTVLKDLQKKLGLTYAEAYDLLYTGGLQIYSTIDMEIQGIVDKTYADPANFPKINLSKLKTDKDKNILNDDKTRIMLYNRAKMFDDQENLLLKASEFTWNQDGSLTILKGGKFNIYNTKVASGTDIAIYIKPMYFYEGDTLYSLSDCYLNIAAKYKTRDENNNVVISAQYMKDYPYGFMKQDDGSLKFNKTEVVLKTPVIQPQSAMTIIENETGYLRAMIGGRNIKGSLLFNRATTTRQPGSSIKPLSIYSTALRIGYQNALSGSGTVFTAAYPIDDAPRTLNGSLWPKNVYQGYYGITYLRDAVERSVNACAVNLYDQLDPMECVANLENFGITTLVKDGELNDVNASALALGGMTNGVTPLEMASAYSTFGNYGVHIETTCYTQVVNKRGDVVLDNTPKQTKVLDESVASLMLDILNTTVTNGAASAAKLTSQPNAGKTGTTSDQFDVWFCGLTPKYAAATWIGCDVNVSLGSGSSQASKLWKAVMDQVGKLDAKGKFYKKGKFVSVRVDKKTGLLASELTPEDDIRTEIFISGTQPKSATSTRQRVLVCASTGYLATPSCPSTGYKNCIQRPGGLSWEGMLASFKLSPAIKKWDNKTKQKNVALVKDAGNDIPEYYCPLHNPNTSVYKVSPLASSNQSYNTDGIDIIKPDVPDPAPDGDGNGTDAGN